MKLSIIVKQLQPTVIWRQGNEIVAKAFHNKVDQFQINYRRKRLIERLRQGRGESQQSSNKTQTCTSRLSMATPKPRCWHSLKELWWMAECWRWSTPWCWLTKTDVGQMGRRQWEMGHRLPCQQVVGEGSRRPEMVYDKKINNNNNRGYVQHGMQRLHIVILHVFHLWRS